MNKILSVVICLALIFCITFSAGAYPDDIPAASDETLFAVNLSPEVSVNAKSFVLMDSNTGTLLAASNENMQLYPASVTKIMTLLLVCEAINDGKLTFDEVLTCSDTAAAKGGSQIWLEPGEEMTVRELLKAAAVYSANDACTLLGEAVAGSEEAFVKRMNQKAAELGLSEAVFYNCHGLPLYTDNLPATKIQNRMTASDMFKLIIYLLKTYPDITNITSTQTADLESLNITVNNTNSLLYNVPGVVGLKTGTTDMSGDCLVTAMEAENAEGETHRLIVIEFGAEDNTIRTTISEELVRYALQRLRQE